MRSQRTGRAEPTPANPRRDTKQVISEEEHLLLNNYRGLSRVLQLSVQEMLENIGREVKGKRRKKSSHSS